MLAKLVVILLLNGVQIWLPAPAYQENGQTYIPAREVFTRLGWEIDYNNAQGLLKLSAPGRDDAVLRVGKSTAQVGGVTRQLGAAPRVDNGVLYVPASAVRLIAVAEVTWDALARTVSINGPVLGTPTEVTPGGIASRALDLVGKSVRVTGEFRGWHGDPLDPATSQGPPETPEDWVLRGADGTVYCTSTALTASDIPLGPFSALGRRIAVTGTVALAPAGFAYLRVSAVEALGGIQGLTCYLDLSRSTAANGETIYMTMKVANASQEAVTVPFPTGQRYDFAVTAMDGQVIWRWSDGQVFTQDLGEMTLAPGETYEIVESWSVGAPDGALLPATRYTAQARVTPELTTYPVLLAVK